MKKKADVGRDSGNLKHLSKFSPSPYIVTRGGYVCWNSDLRWVNLFGLEISGGVGGSEKIIGDQ